jgi:hypothetical protein
MMDAVWREAPLDVLVNNAAATFIAQTEQLSARAADAILAPTLHGAMYCTLGAGKRWIEGAHKGVVLSILSTSTITGDVSIYSDGSASTTVLNQGTLTHTGGSGQIYAASFTNAGSITANAGTLFLNYPSAGYNAVNTGTQTWRPGEVFLGTTEPRDVASPIAAPDWVNDHRAATIDRDVPPGATGRFNFSVRAPAAAGDHAQYFNLVREGVSWFSESGGPADDQIQIRVTSTEDTGTRFEVALLRRQERATPVQLHNE